MIYLDMYWNEFPVFVFEHIWLDTNIVAIA